MWIGVINIRYELSNGNIFETIDNAKNIRSLRGLQQLNNLHKCYSDYQMSLEEQLSNISDVLGEDIMSEIYAKARKYAEEHAVMLEDALCYISEKYKSKSE